MPSLIVNFRHLGITAKTLFNNRAIQIPRHWQQGLINLRPTDDKAVLICQSIIEQLLQLINTVNYRDPGIVKLLMSQDDVFTLGQWPSNRLKRIGSHNNRMIERNGLKMLQIGWQMPWHRTIFADIAIWILGPDKVKLIHKNTS